MSLPFRSKLARVSSIKLRGDKGEIELVAANIVPVDEIDEEQAAMNARLKVDRETFLKYNNSVKKKSQ